MGALICVYPREAQAPGVAPSQGSVVPSSAPLCLSREQAALSAAEVEP